eukprot:273321-Pleurochrysis_carterae.AAC.1
MASKYEEQIKARARQDHTARCASLVSTVGATKYCSSEKPGEAGVPSCDAQAWQASPDCHALECLLNITHIE